MKSKTIIRSLLFLLSMAFLIIGVTQVIAGPPVATDLFSPVLSMAFAFGDLKFEDEPENMGGMTSSMYIAIGHDIDNWPALKANPTTDDEAVTLVGAFTMKAAKFFFEVYATPDTAAMEPENQGEIDGQSFKQKGELFYPGTKKEAIAFCRKINNARGCIIGIDPNTGERYVIGSREKPVYFKPSVSTGKTAADRRGVKLEFSADSFVPFAFYEGPIPLSGGTIPAIS